MAIPQGNIDFSKLPLSPNPDGSPPNFIGGQSLETANLSIGAVIISLSIIFVAVRIYASCKNVGRLFLDDCKNNVVNSQFKSLLCKQYSLILIFRLLFGSRDVCAHLLGTTYG